MESSALANLTARPIRWEYTGDPRFPFSAGDRQEVLRIRVNEYPAMPLYTLLVDGSDCGDLEDWPPAWIRPRPPAGYRGLTSTSRAFVHGLLQCCLEICGQGEGETTTAAARAEDAFARLISRSRRVRVLRPAPRHPRPHRRVGAFVHLALAAGAPTRADLDEVLGTGRDETRQRADGWHTFEYTVNVAAADRGCRVLARFAERPGPTTRTYEISVCYPTPGTGYRSITLIFE